LETLRAEAKYRGHCLRIRKSEGTLGGVNVYETPEYPRDQYHDLQDGTPDHDKYFKSWFQFLPDHCVC
jgi:hypothetical protein